MVQSSPYRSGSALPLPPSRQEARAARSALGRSLALQSANGAVALVDEGAAAVRKPAKSTLPTFFGLTLQPKYAIR